MSLTFSIDTSSPNCSIAVRDGERILAEYNFISSGELSETLVSYIDSIFSSLTIGADDIELVGASIGPGLFTGIRVGLATLKGIFFNNPVPVVPVSSLEAVAAKLFYTKKTVISILDARRGEVYYASYHAGDNQLKKIIAPALIKAEELKEVIKEDKGIYFTGAGVSVYHDLLTEDFPESIIVKRSPFIASEIGGVALTEYEAGNYIKGTDTLEPSYIRIPDAEKNFSPRKD
ncbi:MAG: tRNA (adenosine(37)-N6)-threonylcarbamoyltransferase complex dimerization subunit type 1 TsaB [Candidatus Aminicenantes bacterium]|nr:tRNA (adenosine(37)-N6)-threonylcarbamoyltransferase complex dimerization subunit type 1 TsaB [Candidatus Aminicenantes bacterium]MCK5004389.1 tRNA (adenosine(37)-N6)-threonylcarbamoyltransferase complex dimerization subunit type 1 TsaB [Candidatus Aminicenantes bacterium]